MPLFGGSSGGVSLAALNAALASNNATTVQTGVSGSYALVAAGAGGNLDNVQDITASGAVSLTLPSIAAPGRLVTLTAILRQDATAGRVFTPPGIVAWPNGSVPSLNTAAGKYDILQFSTVDGTNWFGSIVTLGAQTPALPAAPTINVANGNAQNVITITDGANNGSAITSHKIYRSTASGAETLLGTLISGTSYTDSGLTNGTQYFYKVSAVNGVGEGLQSVEMSGTPTAGQASPTHYANGTTSSNAYSTSPLGNTVNPTDGYLDLTFFGRLTTLTAQQDLVGQWKASSTGSGTFIFQLTSTGLIHFVAVQSGSTYVDKTSTLALPSSLIGIDAYIRVQANLSAAAVTPTSGPLTSIPSASYVFSYSTDGTTWTQLGTTITGLNTSGFNVSAAGIYPTVGTNSSTFTGRIYNVVARKGSGAILFNPDFTTLATGQTGTFNDTAATPNNWTLNSLSIN